MATDLDPRSAEWTNADMIPAAGEKLVAATYGAAIAENGGFAAYLPKMLAAQQGSVSDHSEGYPTFVSEGHKAYMAAGTYDIYAAGRITDGGGFTFYKITVDGSSIASGSQASGWVYGSAVGQVIAAAGWIDVGFQVSTSVGGNTTMNYGAVYIRFVDADF